MSKNQKHNETLRELFGGATRAMTGGGKAWLLLSGGADSGMILAAALENSVPLEGIMTIEMGDGFGSDCRRAITLRERIAPNVPFVLHRCAMNRAHYREHVAEIVKDVGAVLKTGIEVTFPIYSALRHLKSRGCEVVLNGMVAGVLWGVYREAMQCYYKSGTGAWSEMRRKHIVEEEESYPPRSVSLCRKRCESLGMSWADPFDSVGVARWFLEQEYSTLNLPKQKQIAYSTYNSLTTLPYSLPVHLQTGIGVQDFAEDVAKEDGHNTATMLYNCTARDNGIAPKGSKPAMEKWRLIGERRVATAKEKAKL